MKKGINIDFKKLSADPRILVVIIALACAALIALCVYTAKQTKQTQEQIKVEMSTFEENRARIASLLALKERSSQFMKQNEEYETLISSEGLDQKEFMIYFDRLCKQYSCNMTAVEFGEPGSEGGISSLSFDLSVEGEFKNLMALCDGIVTQDRFFRIDAVTFSQEGSDTSKKTATITVVAFSK